MSNDFDRLGTVVVKRYGTGTEQGELALVTTICDAPTYELIAPDGTQFSWRQDLTRPATPEEEIRYWRERGECAERLRDKAIEAFNNSVDKNRECAELMTLSVPSAEIGIQKSGMNPREVAEQIATDWMPRDEEMVGTPNDPSLADEIESALLAERERAAKIAETHWIPEVVINTGISYKVSTVAYKIAAAIRSDEE